MEKLKKLEIPLHELEQFRESKIWTAIMEELVTWLGDVQVQLEDSDGETEERTLRRLGGNAQALRRVMTILDVMIENRIMEEESVHVDDTGRD